MLYALGQVSKREAEETGIVAKGWELLAAAKTPRGLVQQLAYWCSLNGPWPREDRAHALQDVMGAERSGLYQTMIELRGHGFTRPFVVVVQNGLGFENAA